MRALSLLVVEELELLGFVWNVLDHEPILARAAGWAPAGLRTDCINSGIAASAALALACATI